MPKHPGHQDKLYPHYGDYPGAIFIPGMSAGDIVRVSRAGVDPSTIAGNAQATSQGFKDALSVLSGGDRSSIADDALASYVPRSIVTDAIVMYHTWQNHKRG